MKRNRGDNIKLKQNQLRTPDPEMKKKRRIDKKQKNVGSKPFKVFGKVQSDEKTKPDKDESQNKLQPQKISDVRKSELAAAKEARIKTQKLKRLERTIVVSKKTKKGQPLMKDRINFLLTKIQNSKNSS